MSRSQCHARKVVGSRWRGGKGEANQTKFTGCYNLMVLNWIAKSRRLVVCGLASFLWVPSRTYMHEYP
eukprot:288208-Pelagomonas_calceolata.AAC.9